MKSCVEGIGLNNTKGLDNARICELGTVTMVCLLLPSFGKYNKPTSLESKLSAKEYFHSGIRSRLFHLRKYSLNIRIP